SPSERPITSPSEKEPIVYPFPLTGLGSRKSEMPPAAAAGCRLSVLDAALTRSPPRRGAHECSSTGPLQNAHRHRRQDPRALCRIEQDVLDPANTAHVWISGHARPKRARYFRRRSASFVVERR